MELILVLNNIRSCYNVGAILRTAEGFGVQQVILSGYTPRIHDMRLLPHLREKLDHEIHKTALGAEDLVKTEVAEDLPALLKGLQRQDYKIVGLENNIDRDVCQINSPELHERLGDKVVLILGEEVEGISPDLYDSIDLFVEIPMKGQKESFNVSVAAGIAIYAIMDL